MRYLISPMRHHHNEHPDPCSEHHSTLSRPFSLSLYFILADIPGRMVLPTADLIASTTSAFDVTDSLLERAFPT